MRKSQIITLGILFIAVTIFIWVGACSDKSAVPDADTTPKINALQTPQPQETPDPSSPTGETPTQSPANAERPAVDYTQLNGLRTDSLSMSVSKEDGRTFTDSDTTNALEGKDYILSKPGTDTKDIYLTFMLDWSDSNTKVTQLLDIAKENNAKFTFFVSQNYLNDDANIEILKRIHDEGHTIGTRGNRSTNQLDVSSESFSDSMWALETRYQEIFGSTERMYFFAPDVDKVSERNVTIANMMGYTVVFKRSNFVTDEGTRPETYNGVVYQWSESENRNDIVDQVRTYVPWAISEGYTFKTFTK